MAKKDIRLYVEAAVLFVAGMLCIYSSIYIRDREAATTVLYYFYSPDCPNCLAAKPIMDAMKPEIAEKKIKLVELNVEESDSWSIIYKYLAGKISRAIGADFMPIPTAVVRRNGRFYTFVGKDSVPGLNDFLHLWAGTKKVTARLKKRSFSIGECLSCHKARHIPSPSTFNCTFCCHRIK